MKLARKLMLAFLATALAVVALSALERALRERALLRDELGRSHRQLGRALSLGIGGQACTDGAARAPAEWIAAAQPQEGALELDWIWLDAAPAGRLSRAQHEALRADRSTQEVKGGDPAWLRSYRPLSRAGRAGAIELAEPLAAEAASRRAALANAALSAFVLAALAALLSWRLGSALVGRPVAQLIDKVRRVAAGELAGPIELPQRDELGLLARELNALCARFDADAQARALAFEQRARAARLSAIAQLAAGVADELGSPLNVAHLEAKRIAGGRVSDEQARDSARVIVAQAQRMSNVISQLLEFAVRRAPRPAALELGELTQDTLSMVSALAARQRVKLAHRELAEAPVQGDPGQLQQVLGNLLLNAVQASAEGGEVLIETGCERGADAAQATAFVRVLDRGTGISADVLPRIFEPFFTTKNIGQGAGLGLAVAHAIVEAHGGQIKVASRPGQGATFTVELPAALAS